MMDPSKSIGLSPAAMSLRVETEDLINELGVRRPEFVAKGGECRYLEAAHYASAARQLLNYHAGLARASNNRIAELLGIRDLMMADNLAYMLDRERVRASEGGSNKPGKVLTFAHNSHLKCGQARVAARPAAPRVVARRGAPQGDAGRVTPSSGQAWESWKRRGSASPKRERWRHDWLRHLGRFGSFQPRMPGGFRRGCRRECPSRSPSAKNPSYFAFTPRSVAEFDALVVLD